tara:strand:- start:91654 stop:92052 length:399 start_codon:yes stop_codon:yes gene_type:complete
MIIPLRYYRNHGYLKGLWIAFKISFFRLILLPFNLFIPSKVKETLKFNVSFPRLKEDEKGKNQCISCGICKEVCPTNAIEIETKGNVSINLENLTGKTPDKFEIKKAACVHCRLCINICPVQALTNDFSQNL